jgi:hypothetical protein
VAAEPSVSAAVDGPAFEDRLSVQVLRRRLIGADRSRRAQTRPTEQGRPLDDILAAKPTAGYDSKWVTTQIGGELFTGTIFEGV